ncbi:class I SAM-dependent methyltransferase [Staphylococcus hominis]|uniref:class I SAM-dependent methyltransferase n=1 Tax=Staphylococcus TaxID=1279 RepID=UPI001F0AB6C8|nr:MULTISPECIES: class I SAM-dependent methyltransferase [Staphylococcus]MCH4535939.1 class I SAM-dependent methyltransferase [Staphylococcus haemolyticus]MCI2928354.1 class I SAM-dependent methyltransferase [Staphylococcus hominis]MDS3852883.1 class I SAM-dependent methyltransferase [Staphylococcus hominis]
MYNLLDYIKDYEPFEPSSHNIWTEPTFSDFVLKSYTDPSIPGGGQNKEEITRTISQLMKHIDSPNNLTLLDIGCGPGIHCEYLNNKGFKVTGVDISDKAIELARKRAQDKNINIEYVCDDIFKFKNIKKYDVIIILYKTYATFSDDERKTLLNKVDDLLSDNGLLLFDVPLIEEFKNYNEINVWTTLKGNNIITKQSTLNLVSIKKYPNNILLSNTIYLTEHNDIFSFNDWLKFYSENEIKREITESNFRTIETSINNNTLLLLNEKK